MRFTTVQKKWLCLFLAVIMMLSGMCLENRKAHSSFVWNEIQNSSTYTSVSWYTLTNRDLCTGEQIGLRSSNRIVQNRSKSERTDSVIVTMSVSFLAILPGISKNIFKAFYGYDRTMAQSLLAMICYIHHQDSSKG